MPGDDGTTIIIAEIVRNEREIVRVILDEFRGHRMISIRNFYRAADNEWKPGKGGLALVVRHLPALAKAINAALAEATAAGVVKPDQEPVANG